MAVSAPIHLQCGNIIRHFAAIGIFAVKLDAFDLHKRTGKEFGIVDHDRAHGHVIGKGQRDDSLFGDDRFRNVCFVELVTIILIHRQQAVRQRRGGRTFLQIFDLNRRLRGDVFIIARKFEFRL